MAFCVDPDAAPGRTSPQTSWEWWGAPCSVQRRPGSPARTPQELPTSALLPGCCPPCLESQPVSHLLRVASYRGAGGANGGLSGVRPHQRSRSSL